jgi:hypothetical protein
MGVERRTTAHRVLEDGHRALISAEVSELTRIFADDYLQYDESGKASTKQDVIDNLAIRQDSPCIDDLDRAPHPTAARRCRDRPPIGTGCPRAIGPALLCALRFFGRGGEA